jgi:hypothetical protein
MEFVMITFNLEYFLKLLHALYTHKNKDEKFSRLMTFEDFRRIGLSTNSNGKIQDYFVYHLQMVQNENLVCTFKQDRETRSTKIYFGLTEKGYAMCDALFEKGAREFLLKLGTNVNFAVCQKACFAIGSDIIFSETKSAP